MKVIRFVGRKGCSDPQYTTALDAQDSTVIDTLLGDANVTVRFELDEKPLMVSLTQVARDFLDLAVSVFIADEMAVRTEAPDRWSRQFQFIFPVKEPSAWTPATSALEQMLYTLSGDHFDFYWLARSNLPRMKQHRTTLPLGYDTVCLFSGGIDSLLGAYHLLHEGKRVLLVGHQADGITASAQTELARGLMRMFPRQMHLVQTRVARSQSPRIRFPLPNKVEDTHRPRSFLFLSLAVTVANALKIREVVIPENGLIAINPPLQRSRIGTLSTRTAHPLFLSQFLDFLNTTGIYVGTLKNPYLYQSKTDMLMNADPALHSLFLRSVSCAHAGDVRWIGKPGVRHCGCCVPCIYRRVAMIRAGLDAQDRYGFDVFKDLRSRTHYRQSDIRALVAFAKRVIAATPACRDLMVLSHGAFSSELGVKLGPSPAADFSPWSDMLLRWAMDFIELVETLSSPATKRILDLPVAEARETSHV